MPPCRPCWVCFDADAGQFGHWRAGSEGLDGPDHAEDRQDAAALPLRWGISLALGLPLFTRLKPVTNVFDRWVIVLLVWSAFSDSVADGSGPGMVLVCWFKPRWAAVFLLPTLWLTRGWRAAGGLMSKTRSWLCFVDRKTMASGMPMAKLLFGGFGCHGVLILPIMIYHQLQMFVCTVLARRYGSRP